MWERGRQETNAAAGGGAGTSAFLGKGCRITGKVVLEGVARIEGEVEGEIVAQGTLIVGEGATLKATITGACIVVHGNVTGDITARERLEIRAPSVVVGNVTAPVLVIHEGASFEGKCTMRGGARGEGQKPKEQPAVVTQRAPIAASAS